MTWLAIVSTAIGVDHIQARKPCQDSANYKIIDNRTIIGVVSDGMGSAKHSHLGSKLAVEIIISELSSLRWDEEIHVVDQDFVKVRFEEAIRHLKSKLESEAKNYKARLDDFACTLLAFVATPTWLAAMQIGDGFIVIRPKSGDYSLVFQPTKGEFINETEPVTSQNALQELQFHFEELELQFICAATDGIENISLVKKKQGWLPFTNFFSPLEKHMLSHDSKEQKEKDLEKFLNSHKVNGFTKDDKALLIGLYETELLCQNECNEFSDPQVLSSQSSISSPEESSISHPEILKDSALVLSELRKDYCPQKESPDQNRTCIESRIESLINTGKNKRFLTLKSIDINGSCIQICLRRESILLIGSNQKKFEIEYLIRSSIEQIIKPSFKTVELVIEDRIARKVLKSITPNNIKEFLNIIIVIEIITILVILILR